MKIKTNKTSVKFGMLILFSIIVLIMPILVAHTFYFKNKALWIFGSKENAYQYLQFIGTFLGVIVTVIGTFIAIERQMFKEKKLQEKIIKQQKEMDIQINLRVDFIARILETKKSAYEFYGYILTMENVSNNVIEAEEMDNKNLIYKMDNFCTASKKLIFEPYSQYSKNISDLITQLENYRDSIKYIDYDYNIINEKHRLILYLTNDIFMSISGLSNYTLSSIKKLNADTKSLKQELDDLSKEFIRLIGKLKEYYKIIQIEEL